MSDPNDRANINEFMKRQDLLITGGKLTGITVMAYFGVRSHILPQSKIVNFQYSLALSALCGVMCFPLVFQASSDNITSLRLADKYLVSMDDEKLQDLAKKRD